MNKREQARKERIDFVLSHRHVGDLSSTIDFLKAQENAANGLYELNIQYAMAFVKSELLSALGWREVACTDHGERLWELPRTRADSIYLSLTSDSRWQFLGDNEQFPQCDWLSPLTKKRMQFLEKHLLSAIDALPPQSLAEEEIMLRQICPRLTTATGKVIDISKEKIHYVWERMVRYWQDHNDNTGVAIVFSMLRHKEELSGKIDSIAPFLATCGRTHSVAVWCAIGCRTMLEYTPDGCICTQYSWLANILREMRCHLAAFYCININWLYTPQRSWYTERSYLEYAQAAIADILAQKNKDDLQAVLQAADFYIAERKDVSKEECVTISYVKGLIAAKDKDFATAVHMFELACQHLPPATEDEYYDSHKGMRLQLKQCLKAAEDSLKKKRGFTKYKTMFDNSLEYFPQIPWYHVMNGSELPSSMDYPGHGAHWEAVLGHPVQAKHIESFASMLTAQEISDSEASFEVRHGNGYISAEVHPLALPSQPKEAQILALVKLVNNYSFASPPEARELLAFIPAVAFSATNLLKQSVSKLSYDPKNMECLFTLELPAGDVEFYMIPEYTSYWYSAPECDIALSAIGYNLQPLVQTTISVTAPDGKLIDVHIDNSLRVLTRSASGERDDVEFVAQIRNVKKLNFLDTSLWLLTLSFDERAYNLRLPILINCANVQKGYIPKTGDVVNGVAWLQGRLVDNEDEWDD